MEESRDPGRDGFRRLEPISTAEQMCFTRLFAGQQGQRSRAIGIPFPKIVDFCIRLFPIGHSGSPITEHGGYLYWRSLFPGDFENVANLLRKRIGFDWSRRSRSTDAEPAEIIVHVIVAVPSAMILPQADPPEDVVCPR